MSASFTIVFEDDGSLLVRMAGKIRGCAARKGLVMLSDMLEPGLRSVRLDTRDITSIDSIGIAVCNWVRNRNANSDTGFIQPSAGFASERLASIAPFRSRGNADKNFFREGIA
jgi:hypothetical protein